MIDLIKRASELASGFDEVDLVAPASRLDNMARELLAQITDAPDPLDQEGADDDPDAGAEELARTKKELGQAKKQQQLQAPPAGQETIVK